MTEGPNTPPSEDPKHEYADERDMDRFWEVAQLDREPAKQWWYIPLILGLILVSIPWYAALYMKVAEGEGLIVFIFFDWEVMFLGLPIWIWIPIGCTLGLSILTSFAVLGFWRDGDSEAD